jgi:dihydroorotate dehydrogenase electron transfer subunit
VRSVAAELVERREIVPGQWLHAWHAPGVVPGVRAGQYVHLRSVEPGGLPVRRPLAIATTDPASGTLTTQAAAGVRGTTANAGTGWLHGLRVGDPVDLIGPLGRPFEVDSRSRHLLLVAEEGAIGSLRLLVDEAIRDGRSVVLLHGARSSSHVYPSSLLPDEVEYVVATADGSLGHHGSVVDLVGDYEAWADQSFAAGPSALLGDLARLAAGRRQRMGVATLGRKRGGGRPVIAGTPEARRKAFLQVAPGQRMGCAGGTCLGCTVTGATGIPLRVCREGPAFAADELVWDGDA